MNNMKNKFYTIYIAIAVVTGLFASTARAEQTLQYQIDVDDRSWQLQPWTGDDRPFAAARLTVERLDNATGDLTPFVAKYAAIAATHPRNALDQFQWAYASFVQRDSNKATRLDTSDLLVALAAADQPHTYNYDRLRLLCDYTGPRECKLCERLLAVNPNDPRVEAVYAFDLAFSRSVSDNEHAIKVEQGLINAGDFLPGSYSELAMIYQNAAYDENKPMYFAKAIDLYEQFLALAPQDDWRRPIAEHAVSYLKQLLTSETKGSG